jgi:hypothetical protein
MYLTDGITGGVTVNLVEPVMLPEAAEIVAVPETTLVARPVALIVATPEVPELQLTFDNVCALPSV